MDRMRRYGHAGARSVGRPPTCVGRPPTCGRPYCSAGQLGAHIVAAADFEGTLRITASNHQQNYLAFSGYVTLSALFEIVLFPVYTCQHNSRIQVN
ncbi:hypothetical protein V5799_016365 [Amblyomma americanum]|uniref:Uncharacterized protein n=1 Tax=Amblyomma americanum TaxID=6943 RepID=A0AAQ4F582_AMBAM